VAFRLHFTRDDLLRVSLGDGPDLLHETVSSLRILQLRNPGPGLRRWQRWARQRVPPSARRLQSLIPPHGFMPDFLTPLVSTDLDTGLDALLHTPNAFLRGDMGNFTRFTGRPLPAWAGAVADGSPRALETVEQAVREWHGAVIAPVRRHLHTGAEAARTSAARTLLTEGLDAMLSRLHPTLTWTPPVLEVFSPDYDEDLHLEGRGLRLVPSLFCGRRPALLLTSEQPVVLFPVPHDTVRIPEPGRPGERRPDPLEALLGRSRAQMLYLIATGQGVTTTDLARRTGVSAATVSHHTAVLRDAGLIITHRTGPHAHHLPTPLGTRLVHRGGA